MFTRPRIIPVLLIDDRDLIKTIKFKERTYLGDPVNAVRIFNRKGIDELSILDIGAAEQNREPDYELLRDIASEAFMPLSYGGGVRDIDQVRRLLAIGFEKVVINTALVENPQLIEEAVALAGSQSVVASIDAKQISGKHRCVIKDGKKIVDMSPTELARQAEKLGVGEILLNSVDRDGMMTGYDIELVRKVADTVSIPVTACGGAGGVSDIKQVLQEGKAHAAAAGSMFVYYGRWKAVLITAPNEAELKQAGIYQ